MKKAIILFFATLFIIAVAGCQEQPDDGDIYDNFVVKAGYGGSEEFFNSALNADRLGQNDEEHLPIFKIETLDEYNQFIEDYGDILYTEKLPGFDEMYFFEYTVLLVYKATNSGSYMYKIKSHSLSSAEICVYIEQANNPENIDTAMDGWFIGLCLDKNLFDGVTSFDAVFEK